MNYDALRIGHLDMVHLLAFSPDGRRLASGGQDGYVKIWDTGTWTLICTIDRGMENLDDLAWLDDNQVAICSYSWGPPAIHDATTGELTRRLLFPAEWVRPLSGDRMMLVMSDGLRIVDSRTGHELHVTSFGENCIQSGSGSGCCFSSDGRFLCVHGQEFSLVMNTESCRLVRTQEELFPPMAILSGLGAVAAMPATSKAFACGDVPPIRLALHSLADGKRVGELVCDRESEGIEDSVEALAASPDGSVLAAGLKYGDVIIWRTRGIATTAGLQAWQAPTRLTGLPGTSWIRALDISPDGRTLVAGTDSRFIQRWHIDSAGEAKAFALGPASLRHVVALPDGTTIVSVSVDGTLATWDLPSTSLKKTLRIDPAGVGPMAVSPDGRAIVVAGRNGIVQCLESQLAKSRWRVRLGDANIGSLTFSPDSQTLAVVGSLCIQSSRLWLLDPTCGHVRRTIDIPAWLCRLAYSPDGKTLVHAFDGRLRLWDLETEQYYQIISAVHWPSVLVFSPDGRFLAVGGESGWVKLLDWPNGRSIAEIGLPRDSVAAIAITPDGRRLIGATSYHDEITVWRREDEPMPLKGHRNAVRSLAVTPDGRQLISASADGSLIVWDLETGRLESTMMILPTPSAAGSPAEWISYTPAGQRLGSADADRFVIER